jgi:hypothetical protein
MERAATASPPTPRSFGVKQDRSETIVGKTCREIEDKINTDKKRKLEKMHRKITSTRFMIEEAIEQGHWSMEAHIDQSDSSSWQSPPQSRSSSTHPCSLSLLVSV